MSPFRRHSAVQAGVSLLLLAVYLVSTLGVLPAPRVITGWIGQLSGERFPCESCGCGCASATECWTHCCCHSEHERLVWAIENGVMPPPAVEFTEEQWIAASNAVKPGSAHCGLCVDRIKDQLRQGIATRPAHDSACQCAGACDGRCGKAKGTCCESKTASKPAAKASSEASCCAKGDTEKKSSWPGPSISAMTCKGLQQLLAQTVPPTLPVRVVDFVLPEPAAFLPPRPRDIPCPSRSLDVPEPPPRA